MFQDFTSVFFGQVQVKQKKVRARDSTIAVQIIDEGNNFVRVADDVEFTFDLMFLQSVPHEAHIRGIILGEDNMTG